MIEFKSNDFNDLEEELKLRSTEFSISVLESIIAALERNVDSVLLGILPSAEIEIRVSRPNYLEALQLNLHAAQSEEKYELCSKVKHWIEILSQEEE